VGIIYQLGCFLDGGVVGDVRDVHGHPVPPLLLGEGGQVCGHHDVVHVAVHLPVPHVGVLEAGVLPLQDSFCQ
jgi:hypothetical protein